MTKSDNEPPIRKFNDHKTSMVLSIDPKIVRQLNIDNRTFAEQIVTDDGSILIRVLKPK
jgi:adenine specific DNA methylase Mod